MLVSGCDMRNQSDDARAEIAPTGTVRVALNFGNQVLATRNTPGGEPGGVAAELAREIGRRLDSRLSFCPTTAPRPWPMMQRPEGDVLSAHSMNCPSMNCVQNG